jgi:hypothetical protein
MHGSSRYAAFAPHLRLTDKAGRICLHILESLLSAHAAGAGKLVNIERDH